MQRPAPILRSCIIVAAISLTVSTSPLAGDIATSADWSTATVTDLRAAHDLIRDNHPGPVDAQHPGFDAWLERGEASLLSSAREARTENDYRTVLLDYINGFADGHLSVDFDAPEPELWPGFLTRTDRQDADTRVVLVDDAPGVAVGDVLTGCGGQSVQDMLSRRVLQPLTDPATPQRLILTSPRLMIASADKNVDKATTCDFREHAGKAVHAVPLHWRAIDEATLQDRLQRASGVLVPKLGLHRVGNVWLISLPSFTWRGQSAERMAAMIRSLRTHVAELHAAQHVVLDLRGNDGGNSAWGHDVASVLWGDAAVEAAEASEDGTVDWRVSPRNRDAIRADADDMRQAGHVAQAAAWDALAARMDRALQTGESLLQESDPATGSPPPRSASPFAKPVLVLTDPHCASACLDFVDLLNLLPGTERVGLPTSADTDYLDLGFARLPSGHARLAYAMKVYRHRVRGANEAYKPEIAWPGGVMTDASVSRWIDKPSIN